MNVVPKPRQRRRAVLSCVECRRRKQKCSRGNPCMQCIARGPDSICIYDTTPNDGTSAMSSSVRPNGMPQYIHTHQSSNIDTLPGQDAQLRASEYGYSHSDSLNSMEILSKVVTDIVDVDTTRAASAQIYSRIRSEYFGYVRRLPPQPHCEVLFRYYFSIVNPLNSALDEIIFREQYAAWWKVVSDVLLKHGPEKLPKEFQCFPALVFQVLAITLQFLPTTYEKDLDDLKFGTVQTFTELSKEYSECGVALFRLVGKSKQTLTGVHHSIIRCCWLTNSGNLVQAWNWSVETAKDAIAIGLHLEPATPSTSQPHALLEALWMNELRKRAWVNTFVWNSKMALALGRPMTFNLKDCTVTPPIDCDIPHDRLKRVPVARSDLDRPSPMTERLLRYKLSLPLCEIRALELEGPIPRNPDKVKELHDFALDFQKSLPPFFRTTNTDYQWDTECPYLPTHRELLSYSFDAFLVTLHRPYIFTREKSQLQVYQSALAVLDSQDRLFESVRRNESPNQYIGLTFPTFDAAILLAVVLVSNPERYHHKFSRPHQSLINALERLTIIGPILDLAKTGAEILQATISRVVEAQERAGFPVQNLKPSPRTGEYSQGSSSSNSASPDGWQFEPNKIAMDWTSQDPEVADFNFSNLEVPMPLKELLLDNEMAGFTALDPLDSSLWLHLPSQDGLEYPAGYQEATVDATENPLWNFLTGYPDPIDDEWRQ